MRGVELPALAAAPLLPLLVSLAGCGKPSLQGAIAVPPGDEPAGVWSEPLAPAHCRDREGGEVSPPNVLVRVLRPNAGRPLLIEQRRGYESVVVTNNFQSGAHRAYLYVSRDHAHRPLLHLLWLGAPPATSWLEVADQFELFDNDHGFRAGIRRLALRCQLEPAARRAP